MPSGRPVYEPTTVSYETRPEGILAQSSAVSSMKVLKKPVLQVILLLLALIIIAAGVATIASGAADYVDNKEHKQQLEMHIIETSDNIDFGIVAGGIIILVIGFSLMGLYIKVAGWRRNCICRGYFNKKQSLARNLQANGDGHILALNPSTDPLVSHSQYAAVSELPPRLEDEERRNLMPDSKECLSSAEESDRMFDPDPRIVLRPLGRVDEA